MEKQLPKPRVLDEASMYSEMLHLLKESFMGDSERDIWVEEICKHFPNRILSIFDVGVGSGESMSKRLLLFQERGYDIYLTGVDPNLSRTQQGFIEGVAPGAELIVVRFEDYVPTRTFDVVNATQSIYYLENPVEALRKMINMTNTGGLIVITLWSESCVLYQMHNTIFGSNTRVATAESIYDLLLSSNGLHNIRMIKFNGRVYLDQWKSRPDLLNAAVKIIARKPLDPQMLQFASSQLVKDLNTRPPAATRTNMVILASKTAASQACLETK